MCSVSKQTRRNTKEKIWNSTAPMLNRQIIELKILNTCAYMSVTVKLRSKYESKQMFETKVVNQTEPACSIVDSDPLFSFFY